jgi:glutathione S-transferase
VPVLIDDGLTIWDSLAIVEYLADRFPEKELWPVDPAARAVARSMCAEMHSGFATLRGSLTMNFFARFPGRGWNVKVQREIDRIVEMWTDARARFGSAGPFLFGKFSIADAYFAPVAQRFYGYTIPLPPALQSYVDMILTLPAVQEWAADARAHGQFYAEDEPYRTGPDPADDSSK